MRFQRNGFVYALALGGVIGCNNGGDLMAPDYGIRRDMGVVGDMQISDATTADVPVVDAGPDPCGEEGARPVVHISENITADTRWVCTNIYVLDDLTFVTGNHTLTIDPGTLIKGARRMSLGADAGFANRGTALVVTRGSQLVARGTRAQPIVFTSINRGNVMTPAAPGDWGGIVLLGSAPVNQAGTRIEGIDPGMFGDQIAYGPPPGGTADPTSNCGALRYVRVEYAGFVFGTNNELNSFTFGGCGSATELEYLEAYKGLDDAFEFFGGNANLKHAIAVSGGDDALDWDFGYSGKTQFFINVQTGAAGEDNGFEADNNAMAYDATPRSMPTIFNATMLGFPMNGAPTGNGWLARRGTAGIVRNAIIDNYRVNCFRIPTTPMATPDPELATEAQIGPGNLALTNSVIGTCAGGLASSPTGGVASTFVMLASNMTGVANGGLGTIARPLSGVPSLVPGTGSAPDTLAHASVPDGDPFWTAVDYIGAVAPNATGDAVWYFGWTVW